VIILDWILKGLVKDLTLIMVDAKTKEVLERWSFRIFDDSPVDANSDQYVSCELSLRRCALFKLA
jgi:hypothetical protein